MPSASIYLNFPGNAAEAFHFYRSVFGGEFAGQGIMRHRDVPPMEGATQMPESLLDQVMHVELEILGGFRLMASDAPAELGFKVIAGNNFYINLMPETRPETRRLFTALADGGKVEQELQEMFWGDYYGTVCDRFGIRWMFNCPEKA